MLPISHLDFQAILSFKPKALMYSKAVKTQVRSGMLNHGLLEAHLKSGLVAFSRSLGFVWVPQRLSVKADSCWQCPLCLGAFYHPTSCNSLTLRPLLTPLYPSSQPLKQTDPKCNSRALLAFHGGRLSLCPLEVLLGQEGLEVLEAQPVLGHPIMEKGTDQQWPWKIKTQVFFSTL